MPNLFTVSGYKVYFWSNENNEPIHVHISKGKPNPNGTKLWLTKSGGCIAANNERVVLQYAEEGARSPAPLLLCKSLYGN